MNYSIQYISTRLKQVRLDMGLSQRELSRQSGVPQSHISKIENGGVDLRLSSLVSIARVLELELELIPRKYLAVVNSITTTGVGDNGDDELPRPAYSLDGED